MSDYDDIAHGSNMPDSTGPPLDAEGLDRPDEVEDALDDTAPAFDAGQDDQAADEDDEKLDDSDVESLLSDVDDAVIDEFDENKLDIAPDYEQLNHLGKIKKRKRDDNDETRPKKKERTREKVRRRRGDEADAEGDIDGSGVGAGARSRKSGERRPRQAAPEVDEEMLAPEERRRRALDRAMDNAVKRTTGGSKRRKGEIDLEQMADEELNDLRNRMVAAAMADGELVQDGKPAYQKLKLLPEVVSVLNRNTYQQSLLDPETNFLEPVRFFLEPLSDGSLPAYNIQRELFQALEKLPMTKEALISSGIGKVIFFYRKSKRVDDKIKRQATKLMEEWSRPILSRSDDFTKKNWETVAFDPQRRAAGASAAPKPAGVLKKTNNNIAPGQKQSNRARMIPGVTSYTIVPQVNTLPRR